MAKQKKEYNCTINPKLWEVWKKLKRQKDRERLAEYCNASMPTIDNALNFGHVLQTELVPLINKFFTERLQKEGAESDQLNELIIQTETV